MVHLSANCGTDCPSSPSSLENEALAGHSLLGQFSSLCSHGSSSVANAVSCSFYFDILSLTLLHRTKCKVLFYVFKCICRSQQYFLLANQVDLGDELEEFDEAPHNVENRQAPFIRKNSRSMSDSDVFSTHDLANQRIAV